MISCRLFKNCTAQRDPHESTELLCFTRFPAARHDQACSYATGHVLTFSVMRCTESLPVTMSLVTCMRDNTNDTLERFLCYLYELTLPVHAATQL